MINKFVFERVRSFDRIFVRDGISRGKSVDGDQIRRVRMSSAGEIVHV